MTDNGCSTSVQRNTLVPRGDMSTIGAKPQRPSRICERYQVDGLGQKLTGDNTPILVLPHRRVKEEVN